MSTLATRPRTATSIRCMIQALMWMLTIPAAAPMISSTLAILHTFPSRQPLLYPITEELPAPVVVEPQPATAPSSRPSRRNAPNPGR